MAIENERPRLLAWEGCLNARDLGGYLAANGRETRWSAVVRSDNLSPLTEAGRAALVAYGVRSIVDLRTPDELAQWPDPFAQPGEHGVAYANISFIDPAIPPPDEDATLAESYISMLDRFRPAVGAVMTAIAQSPGGGVLVHCAGGKDRTGLVAALLLDLVGVPRETIGADYALTAEYLRPREQEWLEHGPGDREERERYLARYAAKAEVIPEVLGRLDERHGGTEGYLLAAGVAPEDIARLRERLLGPE